MATIQDIQALENRIYDAVQEYIDHPERYKHATLHVYLNKDEMTYYAEVEDSLTGTEDDGIYAIDSLLRDGDDGVEPDVDRINDIANSWVFLE